ncbi:MAG TPA: tetratricopeptide repeat protein, partial [Pirellulales bacterium]|nr:tetratricopeptide repeat protein [Pirellulales bacterium]
KKVVLLGPRAAAFYFRASIRSRLGDVQATLDDLNEAIERDPEHAFYLEVRGSVHHRLGDHDAAIADCDRAIELDPELAVAYFV